MHNPRVTRLFLCYNESVRLRNKFTHGDSVGKKLNIQLANDG